MNASTGEIYTKADVDREAIPEPVQIIVIATDLDDNVTLRRTDAINLTITGMYVGSTGKNCFSFLQDLWVEHGALVSWSPLHEHLHICISMLVVSCCAVLDTNDNSPMFSEESYTFTVAENVDQLPGFNVSATDRDSDLNGVIIYTLLDGDDEDLFLLSESHPYLCVKRNSFIAHTSRSYKWSHHSQYNSWVPGL